VLLAKNAQNYVKAPYLAEKMLGNSCVRDSFFFVIYRMILYHNKSKYHMHYIHTAQAIIALYNADNALRTTLIERKQLSEGYHQAMQEIHNRNAEQLSVIMKEIGFPTIENIGEQAYKAAWIVIQHAIGKPDFMRQCAALLKQAVQEQKADAIDLAYLTDRIATLEAKPQLYGTQFDWDEYGLLSPYAVDDEVQVNQPRASLGLCTLAEQTSRMREQVKAEHQAPPENYYARKQEIHEWRRKVGWIL
jgi:hypothetical protein